MCTIRVSPPSQVEKKVFRPPSQNPHLTAGEAGCEVPGQGNAQISASSVHTDEAAACQDGREAPANRFDFRKFGHVWNRTLAPKFVQVSSSLCHSCSAAGCGRAHRIKAAIAPTASTQATAPDEP